MQHRLYGLRGKAWTAEYKRLYEELCGQMLVKFHELYLASGNKFTPSDLGKMAIEFRLPVKTTAEFLEGYQLLPTGTWERLQSRGCKAKDIGVKWE